MANGKNKADNALVVKTFAYPTTRYGNGPTDEGVKPLAGVTVRLQYDANDPNVPDDPPEPEPRVTGPTGEVRFENICGDVHYTVTVMAPHDRYQNLDNLDDAEDDTDEWIYVDGIPVNYEAAIYMPTGGEVIVEVGLVPVAGNVAVTIKGLPDTDPIPKVRTEARNGGVLVTTDSGGALEFDLEIDRPGLIEIRPEPSVRDNNGRIYTPTAKTASQFLYVGPGDVDATAVIEYEAGRAQVVVGALFREKGTSQSQATPLDGVTFQLFKIDEAKPVSEVTTRPQATSAFRDLPADTYRIVAVPPPSNNGHRQRIVQPPTGEIALVVAQGQHIDLSREFVFEPVRGAVLGSVVLAHDGTPVPGVPIVLTSLQQPPLVEQCVTDDDGEFEISGLAPGSYRVAVQQVAVTALGKRWEVEPAPDSVDGTRIVTVRPRATAPVPEFRLIEEIHLIEGQVVGPNGAGAPFVTVQISSDPTPGNGNGNEIAYVVTDENGNYTYRAEAAGTYFVSVVEQFGIAQQRIPVTVHSKIVAPRLFTSTGRGGGGGGGGGTPPAPNGQDNDFPFLTEEIDIDGWGGGRSGSGGSYMSGGAGAVVERELRAVLGVRARSTDPKGFVAALQQAFTVTEEAGHTVVTWNPRSYAAEIQADLGAITGAQASLYTRAKGTLDQVLPLLDGLQPLRVDFDDENVDAIRAIVRSHLTELVYELGVEGGPRVQRIDQLLIFLLGQPSSNGRGAARDPDLVGGALATLRDRLGLDRERINTIDEEQNFTNFLVVLDHVVGLAESWDSQRVFFVRGGTVEPFFGTQLVLLSRDLEVIAESVREVEFAMNSVFLGAAERQTLELLFPVDSTRPLVSGAPPIFLAELLDWVERFATEEGRHLINEGGKQGVDAFRPTVELLQALVEAAQVTPAGVQDPNRLPAAYSRRRVQRAFAELEQQLAAAAARVALIQPPFEGDLDAPIPPISPPQSLAPPVALARPAPPRRRLPSAATRGNGPIVE
jgi:hypothetical protein